MQTAENEPKTLEYVLTDAEKDVLQKIVAPINSGVLARHIQEMLVPTIDAQMTAVVTLLRAQHGMSPAAQLAQDLSRLVEPQPEKE